MERNESRKPIRETGDICIYSSVVGGEKVFIKKAKTEAGIMANSREFHNQKFLQNVTDGIDVGFEFLEPAFDGASLTYPDIRDGVDWLASTPEFGAEMAPLSSYYQEMMKFSRFCLDIPYAKIPAEIKLDSEKRLANVMLNFERDSVLLHENGMLRDTDILKMKKHLQDGIDQREFQHHDLVPWHMARKKTDGKIILVDSGWAGWSLKYYDFAYYMLQMIGYVQRRDDAVEFLTTLRTEFGQDTQFSRHLSAPLSYRGIRLSAELFRQGNVMKVQDVLAFVLSEIA